jgi:hypothetical protein
MFSADPGRGQVVYDHRMNSTDKLWDTSALPGSNPPAGAENCSI